jgi:DNA-binding NarL/FixJ family response regulator
LPVRPPLTILLPMIRVVIVDDHPAVRAGVAALVEAEPDMAVVATVASGALAELECRRHDAAVLVADYHLPDIDGLSLCLRLGAAGPPVVLYSAFADESLSVLAVIAGARAVISKTADPADLVEAVREAPQGDRSLSALDPAALRAAGAQLGTDDLPVLGMLTAGVTEDDIARTLGVDADWLVARRWAMLERLRVVSPRRPARLGA